MHLLPLPPPPPSPSPLPISTHSFPHHHNTPIPASPSPPPPPAESQPLLDVQTLFSSVSSQAKPITQTKYPLFYSHLLSPSTRVYTLDRVLTHPLRIKKKTFLPLSLQRKS